MSALDRSAFTALRDVVRVMPPWMSLRGAAVLLLLAGAPGHAMRHKLVAVDVGLAAPGVARVFDTLIAHGLAQRVRQAGRQRVDVELTPEGVALARKLEDALAPLNRGAA